MIRNLFNFFKKCHWEYFNYIECPDRWDSDDAYYQYRMCQRTGKLQKFHTHCLGLNPPEYVKHWSTIIGKPVVRKDREGVIKITDVRNF